MAAVFVVTLLALVEYNNLNALKAGRRRADLPGVVFGAALTPVVYLFGLEYAPPLLVAGAFSFFVFTILFGGDGGAVEVQPGAAAPLVPAGPFRDSVAEVAGKALALVYIALPLAYLPLARSFDRGGWWIMTLFFIVWGNDTFAYYTGRTMGAHKLSPRISPGKTVEGAVGGFVGGAVAAVLCNLLFGLGASVPAVAALSVAVGAVAVLGDLAESVLKRSAGAKDSGTMIPGHGGLLDRLDSLLFTIPVLYYFLLWNSA